MNPRMFALEYGMSYPRFANLCKPLIDAGLLVPTGPNRSMLKSFLVVEPAHYEKHDLYLGQTGADRRWGFRRMTDEEISDAIDLYEELVDNTTNEELDALSAL